MALWNFTIDDTSPYLSYNPYVVDGSALTQSWQTWYTESQFNTIPDEVSRGDSYHITSLQNANVTFQFYGMGISLFGTSNTTYSVMIDNNFHDLVNSTTSSLLFSEYNLTVGLHSITLIAQAPPTNSSQLRFDSAIVSSPLYSDENPPSPLFYDSSDTASLEYSGTWTTETMNGVPNVTVSAPFQQTTSQGATVSLSFSGGTAVAVKGMTGSANGMYSVSMDDHLSTFTGTSAWIIPDALLFFRAGLDPTSTHHLNITNLSSDKRLCLNSITVYQHEPKNRPPAPSKTPGPSTRSSVNIGVIIGPIFGVLVLCLAGVFFWYHRRRRPVKRQAQPSAGSGSGGGGTTTPALAARSIPFDSSDASSNIGLLTPGMGGFMTPKQRYSQPNSSSNTTASGWSERSQTRLTLVSDGRTAAPPSALSHSSMTFVDYNLSSSEYDKPHTSPSSSQAFSIPESIPLSPRRKPLPTIPVPSYDAALEAVHLSPREVKSMSSLMSAPRESFEVAPPQYER